MRQLSGLLARQQAVGPRGLTSGSCSQACWRRDKEAGPSLLGPASGPSKLGPEVSVSIQPETSKD